MAGYDYNPNNWLTTLTHSNSTGLVAGFAYGYDNEGNKLCASNFFDPLQSEAYSYDAIFRLTNHLVGNLTSCTVPAPGAQTQWQLDPVGNWLCKISNGVSEYRTNNAVNEITQRGGTLILSDDNGNEIDDGTFQYDWDQENRLVAVTRLADNQVVGQYAYDALGRRIVKVASPAETVTSTVYLHDGNRIVEEQSATGVTMATFTFGNYIDEVLTMNRGGQTYYYHQNALWSATALTDSAAVPTERYTFDAYGCAAISDGTGTPVTLNAWGTPHSALGNPFMFTGRQLDEEAGLYCYRARYYSPGLGRFISPDPIGNWADGMNLGNGFAYVGNSPINRLDPMGLGWWGKAKAAVGAVVGAVAEAAKAVAEAVAEAVESSAEPPVSTNETEMDRQVKKLFKLEGEKQMWNEISTMQTCQTYGTFGSVGDGTGTYKTKPADFLDPVGGALFALGIQEEIILRDIKRSDPELAKGLAIAAGR